MSALPPVTDVKGRQFNVRRTASAHLAAPAKEPAKRSRNSCRLTASIALPIDPNGPRRPELLAISDLRALQLFQLQTNALAAIEQPPQVKAGQRVVRMLPNKGCEGWHRRDIVRLQSGKGFEILLRH